MTVDLSPADPRKGEPTPSPLKMQDQDLDQRNDAGLVLAIIMMTEALGRMIDTEAPLEVGELRELLEAGDPPVQLPFLDYLSDEFGLDHFERLVLLILLAAELDSSFNDAARLYQKTEARRRPVSVALCLHLCPEGGQKHFLPDRALRRFGLIELEGEPLYDADLHLAPAVASFLLQGQYYDAALEGQIQWLEDETRLTLSQSARAHEASAALDPDSSSTVLLVGLDAAALRAAAAHAAASVHSRACLISLESLPPKSDELAEFATGLRLAVKLGLAVPVFDALDCALQSSGRNNPLASLHQLMALVDGPCLVLARDRMNLEVQHQLTLEIQAPTPLERVELWRGLLEQGQTEGLDAERCLAEARRLGATFGFALTDFEIVGETVSLSSAAAGRLPQIEDWRAAARQQVRPGLDGLARHIEARTGLDGLVVDAKTGEVLREIINRHRIRPVLEWEWGLSAPGARGRGVTALFSGPSGTGKTLAAEVVARELGLDLFQIDLSQMVSKYIGETQKNLARIFDAAETAGCVLLFDEADALFSRRTQVKDSHDRHGNMEVGYLLQRMEAYSGIAVLTSNLKNNIDDAFLRRLHYTVDFSFPDTDRRTALWRALLPDHIPQHDLPPPETLAQLALSGAQIRNVVLRASALAASADDRLGLAHLIHAAQAEMEKSERALSRADLERMLGS
jgi:hypothetical protein